MSYHEHEDETLDAFFCFAFTGIYRYVWMVESEAAALVVLLGMLWLHNYHQSREFGLAYLMAWMAEFRTKVFLYI